MSSAQCQEYNRRVAIAEAARDERARNLARGRQEYLDGLAQVVIAVMQPHAPLRLASMLARCPLAGAADCHDGGAMVRELEALAGNLGIFEENRDQDRAVEYMRDHPLHRMVARRRSMLTASKLCSSTSPTSSASSRVTTFLASLFA